MDIEFEYKDLKQEKINGFCDALLKSLVERLDGINFFKVEEDSRDKCSALITVGREGLVTSFGVKAYMIRDMKPSIVAKPVIDAIVRAFEEESQLPIEGE